MNFAFFLCSLIFRCSGDVPVRLVWHLQGVYVTLWAKINIFYLLKCEPDENLWRASYGLDFYFLFWLIWMSVCLLYFNFFFELCLSQHSSAHLWTLKAKAGVDTSFKPLNSDFEPLKAQEVERWNENINSWLTCLCHTHTHCVVADACLLLLQRQRWRRKTKVCTKTSFS